MKTANKEQSFWYQIIFIVAFFALVYLFVSALVSCADPVKDYRVKPAIEKSEREDETERGITIDTTKDTDKN